MAGGGRRSPWADGGGGKNDGKVVGESHGGKGSGSTQGDGISGQGGGRAPPPGENSAALPRDAANTRGAPAAGDAHDRNGGVEATQAAYELQGEASTGIFSAPGSSDDAVHPGRKADGTALRRAFTSLTKSVDPELALAMPGRLEQWRRELQLLELGNGALGSLASSHISSPSANSGLDGSAGGNHGARAISLGHSSFNGDAAARNPQVPISIASELPNPPMVVTNPERAIWQLHPRQWRVRSG